MAKLILTWATIAFAFVSLSNGLALPENEIDQFPNLAVIVQREPGVFGISAEQTANMKAKLKARGLERRSSASLEYCSDLACTENCQSFSGSYAVNFCLPAGGTNCITVYDMEDAHIHYWAHDSCNGPITGYYHCGQQNTLLNAPGTSSIGLQVGC